MGPQRPSRAAISSCDAVPGQLDLRRFHAQGFQTDDAPFGFRVAENQRQMRPALVGAFQLRFEAAAAAIASRCAPRDCIPDPLRERQALGLGARAGDDEVDIRGVRPGVSPC